ncbi:MAG: hypothetical protein ABMA00_06005 [Gemmatimonas sp.]
MRPRITLFLASAVALTTACGKETTSPTSSGDIITLSSAQVSSLSARADQIADANPGSGSFRSLVDSTLLALQAGVQMQRLQVATDLTTAPLYFVGIHRVVHQSNGGSFSTWTLVGFESPSAFANIVQTSGFAQSATSTAPTSVSGTIGDGTGLVNGQLFQVSGNSVGTFNYSSGTASFVSSAPSGPCPNGNPEPRTVCTLETMTVKFNVSATQSLTSSLMRTASVATEVAVPAMRLTYTP